MIHFYELSHLDAARRARLIRRAELQIDELVERVSPIVQAVRERGDDALIELTARFDRVQLTPAQLRVSPAEIEEARWFTRDEVRRSGEWGDESAATWIPRSDSISRYLIDTWLAEGS